MCPMSSLYRSWSNSPHQLAMANRMEIVFEEVFKSYTADHILKTIMVTEMETNTRNLLLIMEFFKEEIEAMGKRQ